MAGPGARTGLMEHRAEGWLVRPPSGTCQPRGCLSLAAAASGSPDRRRHPTIPVSKTREERMAADSVYKVIELIGTSSESWEKAARTAVERAAESLRDLRIAEVTAQDVQLKDGKVELFRTKLKVSFKYEKGSD